MDKVSDELKQKLGLLAHIKKCCCASQLVILVLPCLVVFNSRYGIQVSSFKQKLNQRRVTKVIRDLGDRTVWIRQPSQAVAAAIRTK